MRVSAKKATACVSARLELLVCMFSGMTIRHACLINIDVCLCRMSDPAAVPK